MKFTFAATLLLTATSGVAAIGWPGGAGYFHGGYREAIVPKGPWDEPSARAKCKYTMAREHIVGGGRRSRFDARIKNFDGDAGSVCHLLWQNLKKFGFGCWPNSDWGPSCGMIEGDLAWKWEASPRCDEAMAASAWWEATKNQWGGIICRDYAENLWDGGCKHCPQFKEPYWTGTIWEKFKEKNDKREVNSTNDMTEHLLEASVNLDEEDKNEDAGVVGKKFEA